MGRLATSTPAQKTEKAVGIDWGEMAQKCGELLAALWGRCADLKMGLHLQSIRLFLVRDAPDRPPRYIAEVNGISGPIDLELPERKLQKLRLVYDFESGRLGEKSSVVLTPDREIARIRITSGWVPMVWFNAPWGNRGGPAQKEFPDSIYEGHDSAQNYYFDTNHSDRTSRKNFNTLHLVPKPPGEGLIGIALQPSLARILMVYPESKEQTQIQFFIPQAGHVKIDLYNNKTGQSVPVLAEKEFQAGVSEVFVRRPLGIPIREGEWTYRLFIDGKEATLAASFGLSITPKKAK